MSLQKVMENEGRDIHFSRAARISDAVKTIASLTRHIKDPGSTVRHEGTVDAREGVTTSSIKPRPVRISVARTKPWTEFGEGWKSY